MFPPGGYNEPSKQEILPSPFFSKDPEEHSGGGGGGGEGGGEGGGGGRNIREAEMEEVTESDTDHYIEWILGNLG